MVSIQFSSQELKLTYEFQLRKPILPLLGDQEKEPHSIVIKLNHGKKYKVKTTFTDPKKQIS